MSNQIVQGLQQKMWQPVLAIAAGPSWSLGHAGCSSHVRMWSPNGCSDPENFYWIQNEHKMNQSSQNSWLWNRDPLSLRNASIEAESLCKSVTVPILFSSTTPRFVLWNASATNTSKIFRDAGETWWNIDLKSHLKPSFRIVSYSNLIYIQYIYIYSFLFMVLLRFNILFCRLFQSHYYTKR